MGKGRERAGQVGRAVCMCSVQSGRSGAAGRSVPLWSIVVIVSWVELVGRRVLGRLFFRVGPTAIVHCLSSRAPAKTASFISHISHIRPGQRLYNKSDLYDTCISPNHKVVTHGVCGGVWLSGELSSDVAWNDRRLQRCAPPRPFFTRASIRRPEIGTACFAARPNGCMPLHQCLALSTKN